MEHFVGVITRDQMKGIIQCFKGMLADGRGQERLDEAIPFIITSIAQVLQTPLSDPELDEEEHRGRVVYFTGIPTSTPFH